MVLFVIQLKRKNNLGRKTIANMSLSGHSTATTATLNILDLDDDVFLAILSWLSFDDLAKIRLVCRRFNSTCQTLLNKGFAAVKLYNTKCQKEIKLLLPRRDSERRVHMLTKHLGVLTEMDSFFTIVGYTYQNQSLITGVDVSFIPGKILDESYRLIREVMANKQTRLKSIDPLSELRDMTFTASNHFKEHVIPASKGVQQMLTVNPASIFASSCLPKAAAPVIKMEDRSPIESHQQKEITELKSKVLEQQKQLNEQEQKWIQLEQYLGFSLSKSKAPIPSSDPPLASTISTTQHHQSKRSLQDGEEPGPSKRFQGFK